jgi:hypothetical protein
MDQPGADAGGGDSLGIYLRRPCECLGQGLESASKPAAAKMIRRQILRKRLMQGQKRMEAIDGRMHVSHSFSGLAQHIGEDKFHRLAAGEQTQPLRARKKLDEMVLRAGHGRF